MCILPFESAFGCFEGVVMYLCCIWLFSVLFVWLFLMVDLAFFAYDYLATLQLAAELN